MPHLTIYELRTKYGDFQSSNQFYKLISKWKEAGKIQPVERRASANDPAIVAAYCEHTFCQLVYDCRTETYAGKIFSRKFHKIIKVLATDCNKDVK